MMIFGLAGYLLATLLAPAVSAGRIPTTRTSAEIHARVNGRPASYPANYFDQKIDHFPDSDKYLPHDNGTFKQRYYVDNTYYKPGGPVYLYIGGETSGPSRFSNLQTGIIQILMEATNGLGVIIENRYYGESYPYKTSTTDELAYNTNEQTIADFADFAQHAVFANQSGDLTAPNTPWILYGGSLAGAETAFSIKAHGDVLYGGIASSAPVNLTVGYPDWYDPILRYAPQDCVTRITHIVSGFDALLASGNRDAVASFKALFGLESLTDDRDFAVALANPIGNPGFYVLPTWQELNWNPAVGAPDFFHFCGNITDPSAAPANASAVDALFANYTSGNPWPGLAAYAAYIRRELVPQCDGGDLNSNDCFGTQNASWWAETANSGLRSYIYTACAEQGSYVASPQDAASDGRRLLSRVVDVNYEQQWCRWAFPDGEFNRVPDAPDVAGYNAAGGGFDFGADRLAFIDGEQDVWRGLSWNSDLAPQPRPESTDLRPHYLISGAGHHWDSYGILDVEAEPQFIREAHKWEIRTVRKWLEGFEDWKKGRTGRSYGGGDL